MEFQRLRDVVKLCGAIVVLAETRRLSLSHGSHGRMVGDKSPGVFGLEVGSHPDA